MSANNFRFVEIADDLAQVVDGGISGMDVKNAIERWKKQHPYNSSHQHWKVMMNPGSPIEVAPLADSNQSQMDGGQMSAMAVGNETAIGMNVYMDARGYISRSSNSYSAT